MKQMLTETVLQVKFFFYFPRNGFAQCSVIKCEVFELRNVFLQMDFLCFDRLKDLQAKDEAKAANERAKNLLETHIYGMREELFTDTGVLLSTEEEREKIDQALSEASDWLDDEGWDSTADVSKLQRLY